MSKPERPRISVLLPVYNGSPHLRRCIESVLAQTMPDFELVIGDDHSTDGSRDISASFSDERIRIIARDRNLGLFENLNDLIHKSSSPIIRFLCQDDALLEACLEEEAKFFSQHQNIGMSFSKTIRIDVDNRENGRCLLNDLPGIVPPRLALQLLYYFGCIPGNLSTVCVRRDALARVGAFDPSFRVAGDYELWARICRTYDLGVIHKHLVFLREHDRQLSRARESGLRFIGENRAVRGRLLRDLPANLQSYARAYAVARQGVLDVHHGLWSLRRGRLLDFGRVIRSMGPLSFAGSLVLWCLTANNRLHRPTPRFAG